MPKKKKQELDQFVTDYLLENTQVLDFVKWLCWRDSIHSIETFEQQLNQIKNKHENNNN